MSWDSFNVRDDINVPSIKTANRSWYNPLQLSFQSLKLYTAKSFTTAMVRFLQLLNLVTEVTQHRGCSAYSLLAMFTLINSSSEVRIQSLNSPVQSSSEVHKSGAISDVTLKSDQSWMEKFSDGRSTRHLRDWAAWLIWCRMSYLKMLALKV